MYKITMPSKYFGGTKKSGNAAAKFLMSFINHTAQPNGPVVNNAFSDGDMLVFEIGSRELALKVKTVTIVAMQDNFPMHKDIDTSYEALDREITISEVI
jgi:hypothetical protein